MKTFLMVGVLALSALFAMAGSAFAQEVPVASDVAAFGFTGTAAANVAAVGGSGTYSFAGSTLACDVASDPGDASDLPSLHDCSQNITSNGSFTNIVCGTGTATGSTTLTPEPGESATIHYTIVFVGGVGVLVADPTTSTWTGEAAVVGGGPVLLTGLGGDETDCVDGVAGFNITGAAVAVAVDSPTGP